MPKKYLKKIDIKLVKGEYQSLVKGKVKFPKEIYKVFSNIKDKNQELLIGVYLDNDLEVKAYDILGVGSEDQVLISLRDIFGRGLMIKSYTFILIHNHPSGKPEPSTEDKAIIGNLKTKAKMMDMRFLDFIIVGDEAVSKEKQKYWSLYETLNGGKYDIEGLDWIK